MKTTLSTQAYQWTADDGALHVGRLVEYVNKFHEHHIVSDDFGLCPLDETYKNDSILIRHAHTGVEEFVPWGKLSVYPTEEIPTP